MDVDHLARITLTRAEATLCVISALLWYRWYRRQLCWAVSSNLLNVVCWIGLLDQIPAKSSSFPYPVKRETYKQTAFCQTVGERTFIFNCNSISSRWCSCCGSHKVSSFLLSESSAKEVLGNGGLDQLCSLCPCTGAKGRGSEYGLFVCCFPLPQVPGLLA